MIPNVEEQAFYFLIGWMETHYKYNKTMSSKEWQETLEMLETRFKLTNLVK